MAELAVQVPEDHRAGFGRVAVDPDLVDPRLQLLVERASCSQAGHVALHVGHEHRYADAREARSEEHTSELQSLMRISYAVFCLKKKNTTKTINPHYQQRN